jgi:hypothetical protein
VLAEFTWTATGEPASGVEVGVSVGIGVTPIVGVAVGVVPTLCRQPAWLRSCHGNQSRWDTLRHRDRADKGTSRELREVPLSAR